MDENNFNKMINNKFGTYVIENSLELINKMNKDYFINSNKEDDSNSNSNSLSDDDEQITFEEFIKLKNKIYSVVQNNSIAKEKKKIVKLIKF